MLLFNISDVYLSLNDEIIPNHGYVVISDIGSMDDTALICHTNRPATYTGVNRPHSGGNWFAPDATRVADRDVPGLIRNRAPMTVRLLRRTATGSPPEGMYEYLIEDSTQKIQVIYVGLHHMGTGTMKSTKVQTLGAVECSTVLVRVQNFPHACVFLFQRATILRMRMYM